MSSEHFAGVDVCEGDLRAAFDTVSARAAAVLALLRGAADPPVGTGRGLRTHTGHALLTAPASVFNLVSKQVK